MRAGATFRAYLLNRPYGFGRGNSESWAFITAARGDPALPDASAWTELKGYLRSAGYEDHMLAAAKVVWASYKSYRHRLTTGLPTTGRP